MFRFCSVRRRAHEARSVGEPVQARDLARWAWETIAQVLAMLLGEIANATGHQLAEFTVYDDGQMIRPGQAANATQLEAGQS